MTRVRMFMSHSSADKPFVRRLASDLRTLGVDIWIDEVEIGVGDSLLEKISEGIQSSDYLAAVLSTTSTKSAWVAEELRMAMTEQIARRRVKVLPIRIDSCEIPYFLRGLLYASFEDAADYRNSLRKLASSIGVQLADREDDGNRARWYCSYCGWGCPQNMTYNDYICNACGGIALESPVGSMTMSYCRECMHQNPLVAAYCRRCGAKQR